MTPLLAMLLAAAPCYFPVDGSPGWKQVSLPPDAPALAAPPDVAQFRTESTVELLDDHPQVYLTASRVGWGRSQFELTPGTGACTLDLELTAPLRGAKVDVSAWGSDGTMTLMHEERVAGPALHLSWGESGVRTVWVVIHDHLREEPVIAHWRSACTVDAARLPVSDAFRLGRSLYYHQPVGGRVPLCQSPETVLRMRTRELPVSGVPNATALTRG